MVLWKQFATPLALSCAVLTALATPRTKYLQKQRKAKNNNYRRKPRQQKDQPDRELLEELDVSEYEYLEEQRMLGDDYAGGYDDLYNGQQGSSSSSSSAYGTNWFADTANSYYDGYQQAWRYLGHLVKCGYPSSRYDDDGGSGGSHDSDEDRWRGNNYCQRFLVWAAYVDLNYEGGGIGEYSYYDPYSQSWDDSACETHGNGRCAPMDCHLQNTTTWTLMGVYKEAEFYGNDAFFEQLFKHEGYCLWNDEDLYEFMSEARQGSWPEGCVQTGKSVSTSSGSRYLYIDLKPTLNGNMSYGLYTDQICKTEYKGSAVSVDSVAQSMGLLYGSYLDTWNSGLEVYKVCQPCRAYNLNVQYQSDDAINTYGYYSGNNNNYNQAQQAQNDDGGARQAQNDDGGGDAAAANGDGGYQQANNNANNGNNANQNKAAYQYGQNSYNPNQNNNGNWWSNQANNAQNWWNNHNGWAGGNNNGGGRKRRRAQQQQRNLGDDDSYDPNEGFFQCDDDADYTNVNQCMKFRSHAELEVLTWEDLVIATEQGGILDVTVGGVVFGTEKMSVEQQQYREKMIAAKQAQEEAEYRALVASVPSAAPMLWLGTLFVVAGPLALIAVAAYIIKQHRTRAGTLNEPLVVMDCAECAPDDDDAAASVQQVASSRSGAAAAAGDEPPIVVDHTAGGEVTKENEQAVMA